MAQHLIIGQILKPRGLKGEIKVFPLTDVIDRFNDLEYVLIENSADELKKYDIEYVKYQKDIVYIKLEQVNSVDEAERLREKYIKISRNDAIPLEEGEYFICDIVGLKVYDEESKYIGEIQDVIKTGSNDVYSVNSHDGREILIPAIKKVVKNIDLEKRTMKIQLLEGLI
ncbi:MAG: ribosome maturation factor RimM [Clostridia bacterium]|nr:ribosome maturation factor RimM [Clostridia bacterium]